MLRVTLERKKQGKSMSKLARDSDTNASSLWKIEHGKEPAYPKRGKRIAEALGWTGPVDELFQEVPEDGAEE